MKLRSFFNKRIKRIFILFTAAILLFNVSIHAGEKPRIVNIINFVRLLEPRGISLTQDVLYQTVVNQLNEMKRYNLRGTFLLQYDALMDSRYQKLMKELPAGFEVGAWFEVPQPLVEKAGMKWRGRYPWDWHVNTGFLIGYTPAEREKLIDVYMADFKKVFGRYPKSVGCWFIDEHSLNYMYTKYKITASCCCRDQIGVDGYTLWGGYVNQGYYPSKMNFYMPAQNIKNQISVPVFRMLGPDMLRLENPTGMEPAIENGGGSDSNYVDWYFDQFVNGASMEYAYVQIGQENSFGWKRMKTGFLYQMKKAARLRDDKKIKIETLSETGEWFKKKYKITPAASVEISNGMNGDARKTVWFNCRNYRANVVWENNTLRFRDIHLFDENLSSDYRLNKTDKTSCRYYTLPVVDAVEWSDSANIAGLRLKALINNREVLIKGGIPVVSDKGKGNLHITWPLTNTDGNFIIDFDEHGISMMFENNSTAEWYFDFTAADKNIPLNKIGENGVTFINKNTSYNLNIPDGSITVPNNGAIFRMKPKAGRLYISMIK